MDKSIHHSETIFKMLQKINLTQKFSEVYLSHIISIMIAIFSIGYHGKTVDFETHSEHHRTTIAHFLNKGKWDETVIENILKKKVISIIYEESRRTGKPVYIIIDDTVSSKTKPSSKAKHPIEDAYFHFSHLKRKQDYGHQAIAVMLNRIMVIRQSPLCCAAMGLSSIMLLSCMTKACQKSNLQAKSLVNCLLHLSFHICFVTAGMYVTRSSTALSSRDFTP